jgi:hypothetical protein
VRRPRAGVRADDPGKKRKLKRTDDAVQQRRFTLTASWRPRSKREDTLTDDAHGDAGSTDARFGFALTDRTRFQKSRALFLKK